MRGRKEGKEGKSLLVSEAYGEVGGVQGTREERDEGESKKRR